MASRLERFARSATDKPERPSTSTAMLGRLVLRASSRLGAAKAGTGIFGRSTTTSSRLAVSRLTVSGDAKVSSRMGGLWSRGFASGGAAKKPPLKAASVAPACTTSDKTVKKILSSMDYTGTALFAFTGTLKAAVLGQMDLLGCTLVGFTTAVGGGTVRDFMLGNTPVFWLRQPQYIALGVLSSLATFFAFPILRKGKGLEFTETEQQVLDWADSICLGAFCVVGAMSATKAGLHWLVVPVVGMVTSTFGGIIRDLLCRQKPWVCHTDR